MRLGSLTYLLNKSADMKEYFVLFVVSCPPDIIVVSAGFDETGYRVSLSISCHDLLTSELNYLAEGKVSYFI